MSPDDIPKFIRSKLAVLRKTFYQSLFDLITSGDMNLTEPLTKFQPSLGFSEGMSRFMRVTWDAPKHDMGFSEPHSFERISLPDDLPSDPDMFHEGIDCGSLRVNGVIPITANQRAAIEILLG